MDVRHWLHLLIRWAMYANALRLRRRAYEYIHHHDDVIQWKHCPRYWPFVQGIHRFLVFSLICVWTNGWISNLRRLRVHYDVTVLVRICNQWHTLQCDPIRTDPSGKLKDVICYQGADIYSVMLKKYTEYRIVMESLTKNFLFQYKLNLHFDI